MSINSPSSLPETGRAGTMRLGEQFLGPYHPSERGRYRAIITCHVRNRADLTETDAAARLNPGQHQSDFGQPQDEASRLWKPCWTGRHRIMHVRHRVPHYPFTLTCRSTAH